MNAEDAASVSTMGKTTDRPVSAWKAEQVMLAWQQARSRLLAENPELERDEATLIDLLGPEEGEVHDILARLLRGALHARDMQKSADDRMKMTQGRRDRYKARAESMITAAFNIMQCTGERRFDLADLSAAVRSGPKSVFVTSEDDLPETYWRVVTERSPDKVLIGKMLKDGHDVPGAVLANGADFLQLKGS